MIKLKSRPKAATRSIARKAPNLPRGIARYLQGPSKKQGPAPSTLASLRCCGRLQGQPSRRSRRLLVGSKHSVRGFLTGIVRKELGLNLVSEPTDNGRVYRIKDGKAAPLSSGRAKQAA
jgi:hypothetical protein